MLGWVGVLGIWMALVNRSYIPKFKEFSYFNKGPLELIC